jgi:Na+-transporting NADH:ubiquinone oxidoreductase subunit F
MDSVLTTIIAISAITGILAFLLSIANKTIANYGEKKLTINNDKEFTVEGGDSLLSTLIEEEIFIPSACGGKGSCGYCKVKVLQGGGPFLATEKGYVSEEERKNGIRLSCQCKVKEDIRIEIPEELFNVKQYLCTVTEIEDLTDKIKRIRLELPKGSEFDYKPGQYVQILTPVYKESDEEVYRAYSITTPPSSKNAVELFIGYIPEGICTTYIHKYLKTGDKLNVIGPFGDFQYIHSDKEMILAAIGTGMSPIMSILRYMKENNIERKVTFFFGARTSADMYMMDVLQELEKEMENFTLITCLSRPTETCNWLGEKGRVTNLIEKYVENGDNKEAYLCGNPPMIDSVVKILLEKGFNEDDILYDKFE